MTVNKGTGTEYIYLIELEYLTKTEDSDKSSESSLKNAIQDTKEQVLKKKTLWTLKVGMSKPFLMVFAGSDCVYCKKH